MWSRPVSDGTLIYAGSMDHHVYAFKQEKRQPGLEIGRPGRRAGGRPGAQPEERVVYRHAQLADDRRLDAASGKTLWQTPAKGWVWADPLIAGDLVIFSDLEGNVYALDAASGSIKWQVQPDTGANRAITAAPVVVENTLYFASQAGILYAVDLATGSPLWNKTIGGKIYSDLALNGDHILIAPMEFTAALVCGRPARQCNLVLYPGQISYPAPDPADWR